MIRLLPLAVLVGLVQTPFAPAADPAKPLEQQVFDQLLARHRDMTYDQFLARVYKPRAYPDRLTFDPTTAKYFDAVSEGLSLTEDELAVFKRTGFVSVDLNERYQFASAYHLIFVRDLPVLVTTDSILYALHSSFDDVLMDLECYVFLPAIESILAKAHEGLARPVVGGRATPADRDVDLYLTVARNLLAGAGAKNEPFEGRPGWDGSLKFASKLGQDAEARALLADISSLKPLHPTRGDPPVRVYGGERYPDFSQFQPRGHYTKHFILARYFRAMMWLGRPDCGWNVLPTEGSPGVKADSDRELRAAVRFCELLRDAGGTKPLKGLDDILGFLIGPSDNLTVFTLLDIMARAGVKSAADAWDATRFGRLKDEIRAGKHAGQAIRSQLLFSNPHDEYKVPPPGVFQVFGQRYVIDSFVLSQVVYDNITFRNQKQGRMMPAGLDVMAVLGNDEAVQLLEPDLRWWNYSANLMAGREFVGRHSPAFWKSSLYNIWLDALRTLPADMTGHERFPQAMRTKAWQMKQLQTQLGSWAELRHDTVLYAKPSGGVNDTCEYPAGYVEPYPEFYARVKFLATEAARVFAAAEFPPLADPHWQKMAREKQAGSVAFFKKMGEIVGALEMLARKELAGEPFTYPDKVFLKRTIKAQFICGGAIYDGWYSDLFYRQSRCHEWEPVIADVHTDPNSGSCLEVATGDAMFMVIAVDSGEDRMVFVGPAYSYYEFRHPAANRPTDQEWQKMIAEGTTPARPVWTKAFAAPPRPANK